MSLSNEKLLEIYKSMVRIRLFEASVQELFLQNLVGGTTHLADGQEAVALGMASAIKEGDTVTCTYRGHHHALALGLPMNAVMAELLGKEAGVSRGKGGSMHLTDLDRGLLATFAIVGAGIPVAVGAAMTAQVLESGAVAVAVFGDGTVNIGAFHEAVNLAAVRNLPVLFLCENNLYGEYSAYEKTAPVPNVADRAGAYGIPGIIVDGNDVNAVHETVVEAADRARAGDGPTLIEAKTYRLRGHSRTDPAKYRPEGELEEWLEKDPIKRLGEQLREAGMLDDELEAEIRSEAQAAVDEATEYAKEQPYPEIESIHEDIYA